MSYISTTFHTPTQTHMQLSQIYIIYLNVLLPPLIIFDFHSPLATKTYREISFIITIFFYFFLFFSGLYLIERNVRFQLM